MHIVPIELKQANQFILHHHRHHKPVQGHRFSIGVVDDDGILLGVMTVGRPVARLAGHPQKVLEVTRLCTDGTANTCSMLYAAAARVGKHLGYEKIQTYILDSEHGSSLKACGWISEGVVGGGQWKHTDGKPRRTDQPVCRKQRWAQRLSDAKPLPVLRTIDKSGLLEGMEST
jgi:hypothetical protein